MSSSFDTPNAKDSLSKLGLGPSSDRASGDSLAASIFGPEKHGKDGKDKAPEEKDKAKQEQSKEEKSKEESKARETKLAQEAAYLQEQTVVAEVRAQQAALLQNKANEVKALVASVLTGITSVQPVEVQQPAQQPAQANPQFRPFVEKEIPKAPEEIKVAYAAKLAGEAVALEELAKVQAWTSFNGKDSLSSPTSRCLAPDDRLASVGRQLVEMKSLIDFNKPISATPQTAWVKDIKSITDRNEPLTVQQGQVLQQLIDRKVQTLQAVLRTPELASQVRNLKDDKALTEFLAKTEGKIFPAALVIPAEIMAPAKVAVPATPQDRALEAQARVQFPGEDPVSELGRQLSQAQAYLNTGKFKEAKAFLDPAKAGDFADWLKPFANASVQQQQAMLKDKIQALKEVTKTPAGQTVPVDMISTQFLDLMQQSVSRRGAPLPVEADSARRAVLYFCQNPNVIDHVLRGLPEDQIPQVVQAQITRVAVSLAQQTTRGAKSAEELEPAIAGKVKEITFTPKAADIVPPPPPAPMLPPRTENARPLPAQDNIPPVQIVRAEPLSNPITPTTARVETSATPLTPSTARVETSAAPLTPSAARVEPSTLPLASTIARVELSAEPLTPTTVRVESPSVQITPAVYTVDSSASTSSPATLGSEQSATQSTIEPGAKVSLEANPDLVERATMPAANPGNIQAPNEAALAITRASVEQGAPLAEPRAIPQFSMDALNNLINRVAYISERLATPGVIAPLVQAGNDLVNQTALVNTVFISNISVPMLETASPTEPVIVNNDALLNITNISIPSPFEQPTVETNLTGRGNILDGANRGPNAAGPATVRSRARVSNSVSASTWSPSVASSNWTASSGGAVLAGTSSGGNVLGAGGSTLGAGRSASRGGSGGGGGLAMGFRPSWHLGFLNAMRGGGWMLNGQNPFGLKNDEKKLDDDKKPNKDDDNNDDQNDD